MQDSFKSVIDKSESVLILLPVKPSFDQVASGLALYLKLKGVKPVSVSSPTPMIVEFNRLIGVDQITRELGDKNLEIKLKGYDGEKHVEKVSFDIEEGESYLRIVPKPGSSAPSKDQVEVSYSGVSADTAILVGGVSSSHFPSLAKNELKSVNKLVHIGTKELVGLAGDDKPLSFARPASCLSEVVANLIVDKSPQSEEIISVDVATNLVMGIEKATGGFTNQQVTADTFQIIADLLKAGGKRFPGQDSKSGVAEGTDQHPGRKDLPQRGWLGPKVYRGGYKNEPTKGTSIS